MDSSEVLIEKQDNVQNDEEGAGRVEMNLIQQKTSLVLLYYMHKKSLECGRRTICDDFLPQPIKWAAGKSRIQMQRSR